MWFRRNTHGRRLGAVTLTDGCRGEAVSCGGAPDRRRLEHGVVGGRHGRERESRQTDTAALILTSVAPCKRRSVESLVLP
jgi:hypothetical protein